jgi:hypothetical protein
MVFWVVTACILVGGYQRAVSIFRVPQDGGSIFSLNVCNNIQGYTLKQLEDHNLNYQRCENLKTYIHF